MHAVTASVENLLMSLLQRLLALFAMGMVQACSGVKCRGTPASTVPGALPLAGAFRLC